MRYKLISDNPAYESLELYGIYDGDLIPDKWELDVEWNATNYPNEWEIIEDCLPDVDIPKIKFLEDEVL